jgi:hypothetical protein
MPFLHYLQPVNFSVYRNLQAVYILVGLKPATCTQYICLTAEIAQGFGIYVLRILKSVISCFAICQVSSVEAVLCNDSEVLCRLCSWLSHMFILIIKVSKVRHPAVRTKECYAICVLLLSFFPVKWCAPNVAEGVQRAVKAPLNLSLCCFHNQRSAQVSSFMSP